MRPASTDRRLSCVSLHLHPIAMKRGWLTSVLDCAQCTSHYSGYDYYYVPNNTANGINQFVRPSSPPLHSFPADHLHHPVSQPTVADDNTILGLNAASTDRIFVLGSGATSTYWVHVIGA